MVRLGAGESFHRGCPFVFSLALLPVAPFHYAIDGRVLSGGMWNGGLEWRWIDKRGFFYPKSFITIVE